MTDFQFHLPLLLISLAIAVGVLTISYGLYYIGKYGRTQQVTTFTVLATSITVWTVFAMLQLTATSYAGSFWAYKLLHFGSFTTSPALFFYALSLGGARRWVNWKTGAAMGLVLLPAFGWLFTDPVPILIRDPQLVPFGTFSVIEHGTSTLYVAYLSGFYVLATVALSYIAYQWGADERISSTQTAILLPAIFAPMLLSVAQTFQLLPFETPGTILTPTSFSLGMVGIGYAAFRYEIFDTKSLARSRTIEQMNEGYLLANPAGEIIDVNRSARSILDAAAPLRGNQLSELFPALDEAGLTDGPTSQSFETTIEGDGDVRTYDVTVSNFATNEQTMGTLLVVRDITARKAAEQQLAAQRDNIALLAQMVRHDIRNHLQGVLGGADLLASRSDLADENKQYLDMVTGNAENAVELTTSARELATVMLEPDRELEPINLRPIITDEVETLRESAETATVTIDGRIPAAAVRADQLVASIFRNLLKNAVAHNDSPDPQVTVSASVDGDRFRTSVADNGPGIADDQKEQIFAKGETDLESEGTGIGLYLVKTLVEKYDGSVSVRDHDPRGTVFTVSLPLAGEP